MIGEARSRLGGGRGDGGLTTVEWLLIVAAVAGVAALAVVVVTRAVDDTAGAISASDARTAAALQSAFAVEGDARAAAADDFGTWDEWERHFGEQCGLIAVLYADVGVEVVHNSFRRAVGGTAFDADAAGHAAAADEQPPNASKAQVQCHVA